MTPRFPLTAKLLLLILAIVSVPVAAMVGLSLYLSDTLQTDIEKKVETTLHLAMNMEVSFANDGLVNMKQVAAAVAADPQVTAALARPGGKLGLDRFATVFPRADMILVVNQDALVQGRATSDATGDRFLLDGFVSRVIQDGEASAYPTIITRDELRFEGPHIHDLVDMLILPTQLSSDPRIGSRVESALALVGVAPIRGDSGKVVGAAIAADILNRDFRIVDEVASRSPPDVPMNATIAMDGIRVTTNVRLKDPEGHQTEYRALGTVYSDVVMNSLRANNVYRGRALVVGEWQRTIYSPLTDYRGRVVAGPYVGIPEAYFTAVEAQLSRYMQGALAAGGLALIFALLTGWWLTRRGIVDPVNRFVQQIREGDTTRPIRHTANDEIGDLAQALDGLLGRIHEVVDQVREVAQEVANASRALHDSASLTSAEAGKALSAATGSLEAARELHEGASGTINRLLQLREAVESIAEGAQRQERSVRYTGMVTTEIATAIQEAREHTGHAMSSVEMLTADARSGLKRAASLTAAVSILRQQVPEGEPGARALDLIRDPSDLLSAMAISAERLAEDVRHLALAVQENEARLSSISDEMERVNQVVGMTSQSTQQAEQAASQVITWMESMAASTADVARDVQFTQASIDGIATANRRLREMSATMQDAAEQLHQALERLRKPG